MKDIYLLDNARAYRTFLGGRYLDELAGVENPVDGHHPEEWIGSVVEAFTSMGESEGLSHILGSDETLRDLIEKEPVRMLGKKHYEKYGANPGVLVKVIDSAERLAIQVHPTREKSMELFGNPYGKTEAWYILSTREDAAEAPGLYIGFKEGITREIWQDLFDRQDIEGMLSWMHRFEVKPGECYLIEAGLPHAIGAGVCVVEIQEPTDYTFRVERKTPNGLPVSEERIHLGLGMEKAMGVWHYDGENREDTLAHRRKDAVKLSENTETVIGYRDTDKFRMDRLVLESGDTSYEVGERFAVLYVLSGKAVINGTEVVKGRQCFVTSEAHTLDIRNAENFEMVISYGPEL